MAQVGRISGPLLTSNLERQGRNLKFRNTLDTTPVLWLDVNTGKVGINYNGEPLSELYIPTTAQFENLIGVNTARFNNWLISQNNIAPDVGSIYLNSTSTINLTGLGTEGLVAQNNHIKTTQSNSNLELSPNGSGTVEIFSNARIEGNLYATGNITADGNLTLGTGDEDSIIINAELTVPLVPAQDGIYNLGSSEKTFREIYAPLLNGQTLSVSQIAAGTLSNLGQRSGNIFYVAENGNDTNVGDHPQGPFRTIKRALAAADGSTAGPVTIHIFPGTYEEELPLTVPPNTTVSGEDIRNVIVKPAANYEGNDVFLLNGETTIQNLTIKDTVSGYVFRFAANTLITTRSPYIQNITVITPINGANGALVDGADVDPNSNEAGMLFHSCTFITPYSDALVATNGARVEWLNSFTYFANKGIYAFNGTTGHLSSDGSTIKYGAEIRSIGSACVYGNYGIVGDGNEVIVYAINHNLAYIGAGTDVTNDSTLAIVDNEIVKSNNAQVYYQSTDHTGDYRVGENFLVDFGTGLTDFVFGTGIVDFSGEVNPETGEIEDYNSITIENTILNPNRITVGDFRISGNTIQTLNQTFTFNSSNQHNLLANSQTINIETNNFTINGNTVYHGVDHDFLSRVKGNVSPTSSSLFDIGSLSYRWRKGYFDEATIGDISFNTNYISTNISNADLELKAFTNKKVNVLNNNTTITNNLQIQGTSTTKNIITNTYIGTGNWIVNGSYSVNNNFYSTHLDVGLEFYTDDITIKQNNISTNLSNSDLDLRAAGTGNLLFENLHVKNNLDLNNLFVNKTYFSLLKADLSTNNIDIYQNVIETTLSNSDLELRAFENKNVVVQDITFNNNILNTTTNSLFLPVDFLDMSNNASGLVLSRGTTAERNNINGTIRYNTQTSSFEGWYNVNQNFGGLISENAQTKIIITDNNVISLFAAGNYLGNFEPTKMNIHSLTVDNININGNTISFFNNNLELIPFNGITSIESLEVIDETITNGINRPLIFANTNNGFYKFEGTIGIQIPFGTVLERPSGLLGQLRFNTDDTQLEVYDGTDWIDAEGFIEPVSQDEADLLNFEASLILG